MKVISFEQFVEKLKIKPVNVNDLHGSDNKNSNDWYEHMRGCKTIESVVDIIMEARRLGYNLDIKKFAKSFEDTVDRFDSWKHLSNYELLKKHEQRANKNMTPEKQLACYLAALEWYGPVDSDVKKQEIRNIIEYYHDMLIFEGYNDDQLYKIFIEE